MNKYQLERKNNISQERCQFRGNGFELSAIKF